MKTLAERFIQKSRELAPMHNELRELAKHVNNAEFIDEIMFRKSEYIGGMSTIILAILEKEDKEESKC